MYFLRFGIESADPVKKPGKKLKKRAEGDGKPHCGRVAGAASSAWRAARSSTGRLRARGRGGADEAKDRAFETELRADEKEVAEHVMLVDLGRNDVGRVSEYGSVKVKDLMFVERYSHVMHMVSAIEGKLRPELGAIDAFKACASRRER